MKNIPKKIREDALWRRVYKLVEQIYENIDTIIADYPAEQWSTASKLRSSANDSLFYVSQVIGSSAPEMNTYDLNNARKNLFSMQAIYTFATKQKFIPINPEIIVEIDAILVEIDKRIDECKQAIKQNNADELEPWLEKYRIWQKLQK